MFWGLSFTVFGLVLVLNSLFGFHFPIWRVLFGVWLIYLGVRLLWPSFGDSHGVGSAQRFSSVTNDHLAILGRSTFKMQDTSEDFVTVLGKSMADLSFWDQQELTQNQTYKLVIVLGNMVLTLPKNRPFKITGELVMSNFKVDPSQSLTLQEGIYTSPDFKPTDPHLILEVNAVMSQIKVQ